MTTSYWVRGGRVLRQGGGIWRLEEADIQIDGSRIGAVAPYDSSAPIGVDDIDASRRIVIPGLVNAHLHSNDDFLRGRIDKLPLEVYMLMAVPPIGVIDIRPEDLEIRTLLGAIEGLRTGTTTFLDDCYHIGRLRPEAIDAVMGAYERIGARAWVTANLSDRPMPDTIPFVNDYLEPDLRNEIVGRDRLPPEVALEYCEDAIGRYNGRPDARVRVAMAASGPQRCTDKFLEAIWEVVERRGVPCVSHVLETRVQAITGELFYGETLIAHLARLGCLTPHTVIAHGIWVSDADITQMAQAGCSVAHNPTSNLRLGSGVAPIGKMLAEGVNVALGSDGMTSNDAQNIFLEMRLAGCLHNIKGQDYHEWIGAQEAFTMGTRGGAAAVDQAEELGQIEVGMLADLCLLNVDSPAYVPMNEPVQNIVFSEYGQSVSSVLVGGKVVVESGRLKTVAEEEIYGLARDAADRFFTDNKDAFSRLGEFTPAFERAYAQAMNVNHPTNRWIPRE